MTGVTRARVPSGYCTSLTAQWGQHRVVRTLGQPQPQLPAAKVGTETDPRSLEEQQCSKWWSHLSSLKDCYPCVRSFHLLTEHIAQVLRS